MSYDGTPSGTVAARGTYTGELREITKSLNSWRLPSDPQYAVDGKQITISDENHEGPSICPHRIVLEHNGATLLYLDEAKGEEVDAADWDIGDEIKLRTISEKIFPWLWTGTIELVSNTTFWGEPGGYVERLAISADGTVDYMIVGFSKDNRDDDAAVRRETYDPKTSKHPRFVDVTNRHELSARKVIDPLRAR